MKQLLFRLRIPHGKTLYPDSFREILATRITSHGSVFFHYRDGIPAPDLPPVRIVGGRTWVGVVADPGYESVVLDNAGEIIQAATDTFGQPVAVNLEYYDLRGILLDHVPRVYAVPRLAIRARSGRAWEGDKSRIASERILLGLARLDQAYGSCNLPAPPPRISNDMRLRESYVADLADRLGFLLLETNEPRIMKISPQGKTKECVWLLGCSFGVQANLAGLFHVGSLTARGFGRVVPTLHRRRTSRAA